MSCLLCICHRRILEASVELWYRPGLDLNGQQSFPCPCLLQSSTDVGDLGDPGGEGRSWDLQLAPHGHLARSLHGSLDRQLEVLVHSPFLSFLLEEQVKVELCCFSRDVALTRSIFLLQTLCPLRSSAGICSVEWLWNPQHFCRHSRLFQSTFSAIFLQ